MVYYIYIYCLFLCCLCYYATYNNNMLSKSNTLAEIVVQFSFAPARLRLARFRSISSLPPLIPLAHAYIRTYIMFFFLESCCCCLYVCLFLCVCVVVFCCLLLLLFCVVVVLVLFWVVACVCYVFVFLLVLFCWCLFMCLLYVCLARSCGEACK